MIKRAFNPSFLNRFFRPRRGAVSLALIFLLIEFFDELLYGIEGAVLPVLRQELNLSYNQVGLLLGLPLVIGTFVEPVLLLLGDTALRKRLILSGGVAIVFSLVLIASAASFPTLLLAVIVSYPASGAFVSLSQASLMDLNSGREPHWMARWTAAGSLGNLAGPLVLSGSLALALGWRWLFLALGALGLGLVVLTWLAPFPPHPAANRMEPPDGAAQPRRALFAQVLSNFWGAARNPQLLRWTLLLQLSDLLMDVLAGYLPLYFTDVVGATPAQASLIFGGYMAAGLAGDLILIPILERFPGRSVVRISGAAAALLYAAWLLAPWPAVKIGLMVPISISTLGWYAVLQGEAYATARGSSGTVMAVTSLAGLLGGGMAWLVGWVAGQAGLPAAMWLLLLGPLSLAAFVPRPTRRPPGNDET